MRQLGVSSRLMGMFSSQRFDEEKKKNPLSEAASKSLILLSIELCKRKQAARALTTIKTKDVDKLVSLLENGGNLTKSINEIADANIIWSSLLEVLLHSEHLISGDACAQIMTSSRPENVNRAVSGMPPHHRRLMGALIPMAEGLAENNTPIAEMILRELGAAIIHSEGIRILTAPKIFCFMIH
jgi:hypothetical protein